MQNKTDKRIRLKTKIRAKMRGTSARPRLSVFRSNKFVYAQIIDDENGKTLVQASDLPRQGKAGVRDPKMTKTERAKQVGKDIAKAALAAKIDKVVFDRNGFKYTGRVKLVADAARESGLKF